MIEVSGVADPTVAAAWSTVPPFEPGGVIVLADSTSVLQRSRDRYVGGEVTRQLAGADLVVITKVGCVDDGLLADVERWVAATSGGAPSISVVDGQVPADVILGVRPTQRTVGAVSGDVHDDRYVSWSWTSPDPVSRDVLDRFLDVLEPEVLRVKGRVRLDDGSSVLVQAVGRRIAVTPTAHTAAGDHQSELVAIAVRPSQNPFVLHFG